MTSFPHPTRNTVSIVISAYNEEGNIASLYTQIIENLQQASLRDYEILFVNDGSSDGTLDECRKLVDQDPHCKIVHLVRNFGHEIAMTAGMDHAKGDAVIFMDADLQHPPSYLPQMISLWQQGYDAVLTNRLGNEEESPFSRFLGLAYYKILNFFSDITIPSKSPDFRLIDRKYVTRLQQIQEGSRMFRALLHWVGLSNYTTIDFVAPNRFSGKTKYTFRKSIRLATDGIVQFSTRPLRVAIYLGLAAAVIVFIIGLYTLWEHFVKGAAPNGYATTVLTIVFVSSIQLIFLGIIGEYIGRIHLEVKKRPLYLEEIYQAGRDAMAKNGPKNLQKVDKDDH